MDADILGCYQQLNKSWKAFEHKGKQMTKIQVKKCLEYGIENGLKAVSQIPNSIINEIIKNNN